MKKHLFFSLLLLIGLFSCQNASTHQQQQEASGESPAEEAPVAAEAPTGIPKAETPPEIDGLADEPGWQHARWHPISQRWLGPPHTPEDFSGRYKMMWDENFIYILAEIVDDTLIDIHADGLEFYWDDDCLEVFIDENASGGNHQYNHSAFAYHISLSGEVVDIGPDSAAHFYNHHITAERSQDGKKSTWEAAMAIYDDTYRDGADNEPIRLHAGKQLGFAIAYCDNDYSSERENFIGSVKVHGEDKNRGWIDAGIFGKVELKE